MASKHKTVDQHEYAITIQLEDDVSLFVVCMNITKLVNFNFFYASDYLKKYTKYTVCKILKEIPIKERKIR